MSRWHRIVRGRIVATCEAPDREAARATLVGTGIVVSDASWRIRQDDDPITKTPRQQRGRPNAKTKRRPADG